MASQTENLRKPTGRKPLHKPDYRTVKTFIEPMEETIKSSKDLHMHKQLTEKPYGPTTNNRDGFLAPDMIADLATIPDTSS